eukprot:c19844_g1_i2 orf=405-629(-)
MPRIAYQNVKIAVFTQRKLGYSNYCINHKSNGMQVPVPDYHMHLQDIYSIHNLALLEGSKAKFLCNDTSTWLRI